MYVVTLTSKLPGFATSRYVRSVLLFLSVLGAAALGPATEAGASCNVIPTAKRQPPYRSAIGSVDDPIAVPGIGTPLPTESLVTVRVDPTCDPTSAGFLQNVADNEVELTFGAISQFAAIEAVTDCDISATPANRCRTLRFRVPDTSAAPPNGRAGTARIRVRDKTNMTAPLIADIDELYLYKCGTGPSA